MQQVEALEPGLLGFWGVVNSTTITLPLNLKMYFVIWALIGGLTAEAVPVAVP